jgi:hypothetical protein
VIVLGKRDETRPIAVNVARVKELLGKALVVSQRRT